MTRFRQPAAGTLALGFILLAGSVNAQAPENPFSNEGGDGTNSSVQSETLPAPSSTPSNDSESVFSSSSSSSNATPPPQPQGGGKSCYRCLNENCERLIRRANVPSADYVPGVDVRGNAVRGADLEGTLTAADLLPESIAFELSLNPLSYAGNSTLADVFSESSTSFGTIEYNLASGALTLDGERLDDTTEGEMLDLCRNALGS